MHCSVATHQLMFGKIVTCKDPPKPPYPLQKAAWLQAADLLSGNVWKICCSMHCIQVLSIN